VAVSSRRSGVACIGVAADDQELDAELVDDRPAPVQCLAEGDELEQARRIVDREDGELVEAWCHSDDDVGNSPLGPLECRRGVGELGEAEDRHLRRFLAEVGDGRSVGGHPDHLTTGIVGGGHGEARGERVEHHLGRPQSGQLVAALREGVGRESSDTASVGTMALR
jgi:hypothetical protein